MKDLETADNTNILSLREQALIFLFGLRFLILILFVVAVIFKEYPISEPIVKYSFVILIFCLIATSMLTETRKKLIIFFLVLLVSCPIAFWLTERIIYSFAIGVATSYIVQYLLGKISGLFHRNNADDNGKTGQNSI